MKKPYVFSGNALKIIAAVSMLIDHAGVILFPQIKLLRIIGRIAFPIYAFMLAQGCVHTSNKLRYFLRIFLLGVLCQVVYGIYGQDSMMGILISFSMAIPLIYLCRAACCGKRYAPVCFFVAVAIVWGICQRIQLDYGFWGCMLPVSTCLFSAEEGKKHLIPFGICLVLLAWSLGGVQWYSLFSLPLLCLYSGERGMLRMKYFFYIFYPVHLLILEGISYILG